MGGVTARRERPRGTDAGVEVALAVIGALLIALGIALWSLSAGLVVAGGECVAAAYVASYLKARVR